MNCLHLHQEESLSLAASNREECEEVSETQCKPITLTKYRTEIVNKCETKIDDKTCKVTFSGIPRQECVPKKSKRCSIEYDIVPETLYKEECHVTVQHVCEEFVPVPVPVHVGYPVPPAPHGPPVPPVPPGPHGHPGPSVPPVHHGHPVAPVIASPTPEPLFSASPYKRVVKRESEADLDPREIQQIVREMLRQSTDAGQVRTQRGQVITFPDTSLGKVPPSASPQVMSSLERDTSLPNLTPVQKTDKLDPSVLGSPLVNIKPDPPLVVSSHTPARPTPAPGEAEHPPLVTTYELPQQYPGCRSIATKTCHKLPSVVDKKVPRERCREVPDVECFNVLKEVPELECIPEPYEVRYFSTSSSSDWWLSRTVTTWPRIFPTWSLPRSARRYSMTTVWRSLSLSQWRSARGRELTRRQSLSREEKLSGKKERREERKWVTALQLKVIREM